MSEISIRSAEFDDPDVQVLVAANLRDLSERYGGTGDDTPISGKDFTPPAGAFFVAVLDDKLIGSAGWRRHGSSDAELKRMFTLSAARGRGVARRMLAVIEESAREAGCARVVLETGDKQPEAIALYESAGYVRIPDFGFYQGHEGVLSYAKAL
ncbi:GNAT superfamily N-acetyltransferase [Actinoplanes lutulentus]|uniref:Acetyltransferase (GNAT) family protein n=1 Tax=Actinoplanes lutulentus TaxID=1287878 RepID=A0A327Z048_9ACTN|nr:GNAT family N-acetyltransferase [Actinoplanes lutulentus]MBB2942161.1 GNAT superfamily N-acetyltransferase [Actinoplanes lutulentus]RAK26885.1 acetyltransferase (GNAT) family protein [Actinoplanes lutulentus]